MKTFKVVFKEKPIFRKRDIFEIKADGYSVLRNTGFPVVEFYLYFPKDKNITICTINANSILYVETKL